MDYEKKLVEQKGLANAQTEYGTFSQITSASSSIKKKKDKYANVKNLFAQYGMPSNEKARSVDRFNEKRKSDAKALSPMNREVH